MSIDLIRIRKALEALSIEKLNKKRPFSGVIMVHKNGENLFAGAFGMACRAESIPNTARTRFQMASGCKIFTSIAVCQLVERGFIGFDTRLKDCLNIRFPEYTPDITVHHLLTHSSGITSYFEEDVNNDYEALWKDKPMYRMKSPRDFLPLFQDKGMKFTPGERFDYNDGGFIILGLIVEQQSGMPFIDYVGENVFNACQMTDSGYFPADRLPERTAKAYITNGSGDEWRTNTFAVPIVGGPDGGAYTTGPDMFKFWTALFNNRLLNPDLTKRLLSSHITAESEGAGIEYGYGVWIKNDTGMHYVEGWDPGVAMLSAVYSNGDLILTILGNTNVSVWSIYKEIASAAGLS